MEQAKSTTPLNPDLFFTFRTVRWLIFTRYAEAGISGFSPSQASERIHQRRDARRRRRHRRTRLSATGAGAKTRQDLEEEKKQRAKNFDPVLEAVEVVRREMMEHLIKHIRTRAAAPVLFNFLDPVNHATKRRRLNILDPRKAPRPFPPSTMMRRKSPQWVHQIHGRTPLKEGRHGWTSQACRGFEKSRMQQASTLASTASMTHSLVSAPLRRGMR